MWLFFAQTHQTHVTPDDVIITVSHIPELLHGSPVVLAEQGSVVLPVIPGVVSEKVATPPTLMSSVYTDKLVTGT